MVRALRRLAPYIRRARRSLALGLAAVLVATAFSLVSPWVLMYVVDDLATGFDRTRLGLYALAIVGLAVADGWFRYLMRQQVIGASRQIEYRLMNDFFAHLQRLPLSYFQANRTGDLMSRAANDLGAVRMMVGPVVLYSASTILGFVIAVIIMFRIDARLTLLALLPLPGVTLATRYFGQAIHDRFERIQAQLSDMSAVVQEALSGVRVVRAYGQEAAEIARFRRANDEYVTRNFGLIRLQSAYYPSLGLCFGLSSLIVLWVGGREVIARTLTLGEFVAFGRYLVMLGWPMIAFGWVINALQRGLASWERVLEVLDAPTQDDGDRDGAMALARTPAPAIPAIESPGARPSRPPSRLEVRHLTFRYPTAGDDALHDVSFVVAPGETVAIVGSTGAGKTTLLSLVLRLHEPPRGSIFIDDVDVRLIPPARLRAGMALVSQEPFLFSETVGGNIAFGLSDAWGDPGTRERVATAAAQAGLDTDVAEFPNGYDTVIGERGITLSGGQKQRTAIARALAVDPPMLILDDALASVDTATEEVILRQLSEVRRSRTCLIVAHRISTVRDADRIVVLSRGRVVQQGTHDVLVSQDGPYAEMHQRQLLEEEIAAT